MAGKDSYIQIRVSAEAKDRIAERARETGVSVSELLRRAVDVEVGAAVREIVRGRENHHLPGSYREKVVSVRYRCQICGFEAPSPKARCPLHPGALKPV
jgi:rubrerythrin